MTKNRDWRLEGLENYGTFQPFSVSGKFEIPAIAPVTELKPLEWRCFGEYRTLSINPNTGIHFFTDDYRQRAAAPFSLRGSRLRDCGNFTHKLRVNTVIRTNFYPCTAKRFGSSVTLARGAVVIPTISWSDSASRDFCFDGEPRGGIVAVSTVGVKRDKEAFGLFSAGWSEMLDRLSPKRVIVCGEVFDFMARDVIVEPFGAFTDKFDKMRKEG